VPIFSDLLGKSLTCGNGQSATVAPGVFTGTKNPSTCSPFFLNPNLREPVVYSWTLSVAHAFTKNLSTNIAYVGNHASGLRSEIDLNQPTPGDANGPKSATLPNGTSTEQDRRPFTQSCPVGSTPGALGLTALGPCLPWFSTVNFISNGDESNYDALQATLTLRATRGLSFNLSYTYAHALDDFSGNENIWTIASDATHPQRDYGTTGGSPQRISFTGNYTLPSRKGYAQMLSGWALNGTTTYIPKRYASIAGFGDLSGTGEGGDKAIMFGPTSGNWGGLQNAGLASQYCFGPAGSTAAKAGCSVGTIGSIGPGGICSIDAALINPQNSPAGTTGGATPAITTAVGQLNTIGCQVLQNGAVVLPPAQGNRGNEGKNTFYSHGPSQIDGSVTKTFGFLKEQRLKAQFRIEVFNILNQTIYSGGGGNGGNGAGPYSNSTPNNGQSFITAGGSPREVQLGLKFIF